MEAVNNNTNDKLSEQEKFNKMSDLIKNKGYNSASIVSSQCN